MPSAFDSCQGEGESGSLRAASALLRSNNIPLKSEEYGTDVSLLRLASGALGALCQLLFELKNWWHWSMQACSQRGHASRFGELLHWPAVGPF